MGERRTAAEVKAKVERRMALIDALTPDQRALVHEFGWRIVKEFMDCGVHDHRRIRRLIDAVLGELRPPEIMNSKPGPEMMREFSKRVGNS